jgi:crotonobetainyl-CoA:carnitine CoA-transferase CaiB-like acyl-CoA transferase
MTPLYARIGELTPSKTADAWIELLLREDYPIMLARDLDDVIEEPHLKATGFFRLREHPTEGMFREMRPPVRYSARPDPELGFAPTLGQNSDEIRKEVER